MSKLEKLLQKIRSGRKLTGLGLMSGTSADGLDLALVEFSKNKRPRFRRGKTHRYSAQLRKKILELQETSKAGPEELILFSQFLGERWAAEISKFLKTSGGVDFIASHGQTVRHIPEFRKFLGRRLRGTLQLGEAEAIAKRLGIVTVSDCRAADVALGGSGAPLMPYVHQHLFSSKTSARGILNIGGIANLTFLGLRSFWASDIGVGNAWSDYLARKFYGKPQDEKGKIASRGAVSAALLADLKQNRFYARAFPKSTGREDFSVAWLEKVLKRHRRLTPADVLATVGTLAAWGAAEALRRNRREKLDELYLAGGGAKNLFFIKQLQNFRPDVSFHPAGQLGFPSDFLEAAGFAVLGYWCLSGETIGSATVTGAEKRGVLGKISPG